VYAHFSKLLPVDTSGRLSSRRRPARVHRRHVKVGAVLSGLAAHHPAASEDGAPRVLRQLLSEMALSCPSNHPRRSAPLRAEGPETSPGPCHRPHSVPHPALDRRQRQSENLYDILSYNSKSLIARTFGLESVDTASRPEFLRTDRRSSKLPGDGPVTPSLRAETTLRLRVVSAGSMGRARHRRCRNAAPAATVARSSLLSTWRASRANLALPLLNRISCPRTCR
jgi:hypothetical protein